MYTIYKKQRQRNVKKTGFANRKIHKAEFRLHHVTTFISDLLESLKQLFEIHIFAGTSKKCYPEPPDMRQAAHLGISLNFSQDPFYAPALFFW